jgi:hypothetical protein
VVDAGVPASDAGIPVADGGTVGVPDAGPIGGGPNPTPDAGTPADECAGLTPAAVPAPVQLQLGNADLDTGGCQASDVDGTGHVAVHYDVDRGSTFTFFESATGAAVGNYQTSSATLFGQNSGFIGGECAGATCEQDYVVLSPTGQQLFKSPVSDAAGMELAVRNPLGGMVTDRVQASGTPGFAVILIDNVAADGTIRWTRQLPALFHTGLVVGGVDRMGNTLIFWDNSDPIDPTQWAAIWYDPAGNPGQVFSFSGAHPTAFFERVGSGLFISSEFSSVQTTWIGQIDAFATAVAAPPDWLAARPNTTLHPVHGGTGYAVLPTSPQSAASCQQQLELIAPSGKSCGTATFAVDSSACSTAKILVGFDGTVVQQLPQDRETCTAGGHVCTCTWHSWPGFFR